MAKRRKVDKGKCKCDSSCFFKILLPILVILLILVLIFKSGLMGNSVYSPCVDSDNTVASSLGEIETDDASIFIKGSVSQGYTTMTDVCEGFRVIEYFCDNGHRDSRPIYCGDNKCVDGACKK